MPISSAEVRARWRKRKRDQRARKAKLKEQENDTFEDNEEDDDPDLDPPQNHPEDEVSPQHYSVDHAAKITGKKESERLASGGSRICEFPVSIKREIIRPHSSVFQIVEAEVAARNGDGRGQEQGWVAVLENISYGQLQALSAVPRNSPALSGVHMEETVGSSAVGSYVIAPPRIIAGRGVTKTLDSEGCLHVVPVHSDWFSLKSVHRLERQVVPHFFSGKSVEHTPEKYMKNRNLIVAKYMENPEKYITVADCQGLVTGLDNDDLTRIVGFLDHWGIVNYCATPTTSNGQIHGAYLCEDSNNEFHVPSSALKSIDSLIKFDNPKCRLKAAEVYPELACRCKKDCGLDSTILEQLTEHYCSCCSQPIASSYYQSQKEVDVGMCLNCYHGGGFISGHSSLDFCKEDSFKSYIDADGDAWSDQETLLLLEGLQLYKENWNKIAEHVSSKSKPQCILHFVSLPLDGIPLDNITLDNTDVPCISGSLSRRDHDNHKKAHQNSNGFCSQGNDMGNKFPFSNSGNPVMYLVAFIASALGPRVAAACAFASLASLSKDGSEEGNQNELITNLSEKGPRSQHEVANVPLSAEKVEAAATDGLVAAAVKSKLFADHEEREIQRLSANIVNHQLKRLELKLKQFAEIETLLMRECEQMERARHRISAECALLMSTQFGTAGLPQPIGLLNNAPENKRQQVPTSQQPFVPGYGNNQLIRPHVSLMQQQGGLHGCSPGLPLSAIQSSLAASNTMLNSPPPSSSQPSVGHPALRSGLS